MLLSVGFDEYVKQTKDQMGDVNGIADQVRKDLAELESSLQGVSTQVDKAMTAAKALNSTVAQFDDQIQGLKNAVRFSLPS